MRASAAAAIAARSGLDVLDVEPPTDVPRLNHGTVPVDRPMDRPA